MKFVNSLTNAWIVSGLSRVPVVLLRLLLLLLLVMRLGQRKPLTLLKFLPNFALDPKVGEEVVWMYERDERNSNEEHATV